MPVRGGDGAKRNISAKINSVANQKVEQAIAIVAADVGARADFYVPEDTTNLLKSREIRIHRTKEGWQAEIVYKAPYVRFLHERDNWEPKPVPSPGKKTGSYNPNARPDWLNIGADEAWPEAQRTFRRVIKF
jgi:hypothetical protein